LTPRFLASATWDLVEAIRNGLASFSDCAQPIVSLLKSILPIPRSEPLHIGPYCASTPAGRAVVSFAVPPAAVIAAGTAPPAPPDDGAAEADAAPDAGALELAPLEEAPPDMAALDIGALDMGALDEPPPAAAELAADEGDVDDDDEEEVVDPELHPATRRTAPAAAMRAVRR